MQFTPQPENLGTKVRGVLEMAVHSLPGRANWDRDWKCAALVLRFDCLYLTQFLMDFGQILDSKSYDQA